MISTIGKKEFALMFAAAAQEVRSQHATLSALDAFAGDGDHGTTMLRVADQLESAVDPASSIPLMKIFETTGWNVMGVDGGASSAILGTFFRGMGAADIGDEVDCRGLAVVFQAGLNAVSKQTKAIRGDKTMMDALIPAVAAIDTAASSEKDICSALEMAALAAREGAESTKSLIAKHGRAKHLGEKTIGHMDAGAFSISLLFAGFSAALNDERNK